MTKSIYEPNLWRDAARSRYGVKNLQERPLAFKWWTPDCDETDANIAAQGCRGDEPPLVNGWAQPSDGSGLEKFAFRLHADGSLEFKGHLNAAGASSGTVAVTLPGANAGEVDFLIANDQYFLTLITDGGTSFTSAMVFIDSTTGDVTITWPIS